MPRAAVDVRGYERTRRGKRERVRPYRRVQDIMGLSRRKKYEIYDQLKVKERAGHRISTKEDRSGFPAIIVSVDGRPEYLTDVLSMEDWHRRREGLRHYVVAARNTPWPYGVSAKDKAGAIKRVEEIVGHPLDHPRFV